VREEGLLRINHLALVRAAGAFALIIVALVALVALVDDESPPQLLTAGMKFGLTMFVELGACVERVLLVERYSRVDAAFNARQVDVFCSE
jgi:hypothetical protein